MTQIPPGGTPCPQPATYRAPFTPNNACNFDTFWSYHPNGSNFLFGDASVRYFTYSTKQAIMNAMATRSGNEDLSD